LTKVYTPGETKDQRKARKEKERLIKEKQLLTPVLSTVPILPPELPLVPKNDGKKRYVVCLKHGTKYRAEYVNNLHRMTKRNLTLEHEFVCFTEDPTDIDPEIKIMPLPHIAVSGWWYKPMFFNPNLGLEGTILYLDLDLIIFQNIDYLFQYQPEKFCIIRDFNRTNVKNYQKMNSSVFRLETGQNSHIYEDFIKDPKINSRRYHGDQDWIFAKMTRVPEKWEYWPDEWIQSYKWEMRGKPRMTRDTRGHRNFETAGEPRILQNTSIAVFHGDPNPHNCIDPWCKENWG